ncbi:hypothetical protein PT974_03105 [Cladobotryum mycophilum]|uniref:DUF6536 domain-containing protein n=1 Tax=Cladobotryum mycophilum TaxID=491253 RepID=A0ABR0SRC0_9HYPO
MRSRHMSPSSSNNEPLIVEILPEGVPKFAKKDILKIYIPEVDPNHKRAQSFGKKMAKRKTKLNLQTIVALSAFIASTGTIIWALTRHWPDERGIGTLYLGDCSVAAQVNRFIHLVLNLVSTLLLGAGSYCMQVLMAPERHEVNTAHSEGSSMEIGVLSYRNRRFIPRGRVVLWHALGIVSIFLHLFWNSIVYSSLPFVLFPTAIVTSDFLEATDDWHRVNITTNADKTLTYALHEDVRNFIRLPVSSCIQKYIDPLKSTSDLVLVAKNLTASQRGSSLIKGWVSGDSPNLWQAATQWICEPYEPNPLDWTRYCSATWAKTFSEHWVQRISPPERIVEIDYCLVGPEGNNQNRCGLNYNVWTVAVVWILALLETAFVFCTRKKFHESTLLTLGDAVASFLEEPTKHVEFQRAQAPKFSRRFVFRAIPWKPEHSVKWSKAVGLVAWALAIGWSIVLIVVISVVLGIGISGLQVAEMPYDFLSLASYGLGKVNGALIVGASLEGGAGRTHFFMTVVLSNIAQLLLSLAYTFWNNILTRQLIADELIRFLQPEVKKTLRVSAPRGMQRSSHFLSLPLKYSVGFMLVFTALHWLLSQSIFNIQTIAFQSGPGAQRLPQFDSAKIGYSPLAMICTLIISIVFFLVITGNAILRSHHDVPATLLSMATDSYAISSLCQRPDEDKDASLFPVRLGAVPPMDDATTHSTITFSTYISLEASVKDQVYRQPCLV